MRATLTKLMLFTTVMLLGVTVAQPAFADKGRHGYHGHSYKHYRHHDRHYNRHYRHGYRHRRHHRDRVAYLAGGLVLGSIITHALHRPHEPVVSRRVYRDRVYVDSGSTRRLLRDVDGNCYEREYNRRGDEILIALPDSACAW